MDKSAIKSFAIEARKILMKSAITQAGFYGVSKDGCAQPTQKGAGFEVYRTIAGTDNRIFGDDIKRREKLVRAVEEKGFEQVIEETAYTWFNRLIAIRFMEVNGYLPTRTRVLSSETGSNTPDLMSQYMDVDLDMTMDELEKVQTCVRENRYDDAFALLFVKQCNALNEILPELFEKTTDYMELLLKLSYTSDGVVRMLVDTIPESNFDIEQEGQIEIIGWMYQYYNTELKDDTFALLKKNVKITKERIPSATQLFTPDWIVRYMVENSLGRLWVEGHPDDELKANWKYYLEEAEQEADVQVQLEEIRKEYKSLNPEDIKVIDPCMGSGHILVYCFDVLMQIYESQGYTQRDAARLILENNLYGLDIDRRATQLAYFAVMMKARQYDRRIFSRGVRPHTYAIEESNGINRNQLKFFGGQLGENEKRRAKEEIFSLLDTFMDAKEYGSILKVQKLDWELLKRFVDDLNDSGQLSFDTVGIEYTQKMLHLLINQGRVMEQKYAVVVTNPPYMGNSGMGAKLTTFVKKEYPDSKSDMSTVCMERCLAMCRAFGFVSMINIPVWMFLTSYEKLRDNLMNYTYINLVHPGRGIFGSDFGTTTFVIGKMRLTNYIGTYKRLYKQQGDVESIEEREKSFFSGMGTYHAKQDNYHKVPGRPIAYWASSEFLQTFEQKKIGDVEYPKQGLSTADNDRFLRLWHEVDYTKINISCKSREESSMCGKKWFPFNKGGDYRKWYGNFDYVINWENDGLELRNFKNAAIRNPGYYFKPHVTWSKVSISNVAFRYRPEGSVFSDAGCAAVFDEDTIWYALGLLNTKFTQRVFDLINPTVNYTQSTIASVPYIEGNKEKIISYVKQNMQLSKDDWDSFENSWDFKVHPLVRLAKKHNRIEQCYSCWEAECDNRFKQMKDNEESINLLIHQLLGVQDEISEKVDDKEVSVRKADLKRDIKSLISYAVGCMFGRYSLDNEGLIYAGGEWPANYNTFIPDGDGCIPITDEAYFGDDIVNRFCDFLKIVYGEETLEQNIDFVASTLENKGSTSLEVIRNYFLNDFFKEHCKDYSITGSGKRPVYWLFDSGKQNGFKCLIYMHRYDKDTVGRVRSDHLRKSQEAIEAALKNAEYTIQNSTSAIDKATATKKRDKYIKQLSEIRTYFQALSHVALQRIDIDLDDGVKVNYEKFQNIEIVDENGKKQKINLLTKI